MKTDSIWASGVGGVGMGLTYLFGGNDKMFHALVILMLIDFATGWAVGYKEKQVSSKKAYNGAVKKAVMLLMVIVAVQVDYLTGTENVFRNMMIWYLIGIEFTSFIENAGRFGLYVPEAIKAHFTQLKNKK